MIEILAAKVMSTDNLAKLGHWKTKSYAQHVALGEFYDALPGKIDRIVECYQGAFGVITIPELPAAIFKKDITSHLEDEVKWITDNQEKICKGLKCVSNLIDSLAETYFVTIYKLKNLS